MFFCSRGNDAEDRGYAEERCAVLRQLTDQSCDVRRELPPGAALFHEPRVVA